jgi:hypothetical protein
MPLTLLAILLAFAAPAPIAESTIVLEDEAIVEVSRRTTPPRAVVSTPRPPMCPPAPRALVPVDPDVRFRPAVDWTPRAFSRPPPL